MGRMQPEKGRAFEQKVATLLREHYPTHTVRRSLQSEKAYESDVVVEGVPIWWECQDAREPNPLGKLAQGERDVGRAELRLPSWSASAYEARPTPVVVWHRLRAREILVTLRLPGLASLCSEQWTSVSGGGAVVTLTLKDFLNELT